MTLRDKTLNTYKCFATKTIADNLNNVKLQDGLCYIRSLGLIESKTNTGNKYYNFDIMFDAY